MRRLVRVRSPLLIDEVRSRRAQHDSQNAVLRGIADTLNEHGDRITAIEEVVTNPPKRLTDSRDRAPIEAPDDAQRMGLATRQLVAPRVPPPTEVPVSMFNLVKLVNAMLARHRHVPVRRALAWSSVSRLFDIGAPVWKLAASVGLGSLANLIYRWAEKARTNHPPCKLVHQRLLLGTSRPAPGISTGSAGAFARSDDRGHFTST